LEFELESARGGTERNIDRSISGVGLHVEGDAVITLARHLAVRARMLASQGDNEEVKARELIEVAKLGAELHCEELSRDR
jgi:hypothetical protein